MLPETNKNKYKQKLEPFLEVRVIGLVVFAIIILLVSWSGLKVLQTNYELEKKMAQLQQRNSLKKLENENIKLKNTYYESNQYLELTARRQFNKAAPGERLYLVPSSVAMAKTVELPKEQVTTKKEPPAKSKYAQNLDDWMKFLFQRKQQNS